MSNSKLTKEKTNSRKQSKKPPKREKEWRYMEMQGKVNTKLKIHYIYIPFLFQFPSLFFWNICIYFGFLFGKNESARREVIVFQQGEPFLQLSAPAPVVMEPTREDGLALKLEALA